MFDAKELEIWSTGQWWGEISGEIQGFCYDTRVIKSGEIFLALKTENRDGHDFLQVALEGGAIGAIVEEVKKEIKIPQLRVDDVLKALGAIANGYRNKMKIPVLGITGSCGKTSTKEMLRRVLGGEKVCANYLNNNNLLGVPLTLMEVDEDLHEFAVIEAGASMLGEMGQLGEIIEPDIAIVTCLGVAHSAFFGSKDVVAQEKFKLVQRLKPGGVSVFPYACCEYECFNKFKGKKKILIQADKMRSVSILENEEYYEYEPVPLSDFILLRVKKPGHFYKLFKLPLMTEGMVQNAALVVIAAWCLGVEDYLIQERFLKWKPVEKRGEIIRKEGKEYYLDCYNSNPQSVLDSIGFFQRKYVESKDRAFVLGGMGELGEKSGQMHYDTGREIELKDGDRVFVVEKGFPETNRLRQGLLDAGGDGAQVEMCKDLEEVAQKLKQYRGAVFLKGSKSVGLWKLVESNKEC